MSRQIARAPAFFKALFTLMVLAGGISCARSTTPNYLIRSWQVENGLPQNKVTAVVQTRDGYLWLGTYSGLARFDGVHFTVFDGNNTPELRSSRVTSLCEGTDDTLWIGDESGQVTQYKDGKFKSVPFHPGWSGGKIYDIATDESGDVWLLNESGELARVRDERVLTPEAGTAAKLVDMTRSANGAIWVARDGRVSALEHGQLHPLKPDRAGSNDNTYVMGIGASRDGGLYVAVGGRIRKWKYGDWAEDLGPAPWDVAPVTRWIETKKGVLVAGTADRGIFLLFPDRMENSQHFDNVAGFPSDWVISLCQDREGNLWSGTGSGLVMMRPNNLQTLSPPNQWKGRAVLSVCPGRDGALWVGTEGAGLYRFKNGGWTNFSTAQGILNPYVWSLAEDESGRMWAGTYGGGLFVQQGGSFEFAKGMENITPPMPALLSSRDALWIGTTSGLLRYENGSLTRFNPNHGQPLNDVRAIDRDRQGAIWFGTAGNGLGCLQDQTIRQFKKSDGLSSDFIECLHFDVEGTLWIGTFGGGLDRFKDGHFATINRNQGLANSVIGDIEDDGRGFFWMSSFGGIMRVSKTELNDCADGKIQRVHCLTYGINDGLSTLECSEGLQPAGCKTPDGHLWFPTGKGLVEVDPGNMTTNFLPPPVIIDEMRVDDKPFTTGEYASTSLKVLPGRHRIEFQYTGLSFVTPEKVLFKYRLDGFDEDWVDAGTKRLASYNYVPPGNYSFRVIACNNDGVWNETGASLAFGVLPYFWQTSWFRFSTLGLVIAASGGLVWFDTRRRMRRKLERAERQRDIEHERTRIARDIHDDLGVHLTRITMISESVRGNLGNASGPAATGVDKIYDMARELTRSMDEIVWAVNPRHDTLESLATYLEKFAQDWLASAGIRCRLDLPVQFPEWRLTSEVRHNLFLACKEALHNVVKHSGATEVSIRLVVSKMAFELSIEDNGRGFFVEARERNPAAGPDHRSSGNGLENMRRRLLGIGGTCGVYSEPGKGTRVIFSIRFQTASL